MGKLRYLALSQGVWYASKGRAGAYWVELSAALEGPERRLFRRLGKNNAVIATRGLIKRETIVRFSIELEMLRPVHPSLYCSINDPDTHTGRCFVWRPLLPVATHEQTLNHR